MLLLRMRILCVFTGDIGGYMGLLLGCSVITLVELLDLFLYNGCVKCLRLSGGKKANASRV